jgi:hypothetical protein
MMLTQILGARQEGEHGRLDMRLQMIQISAAFDQIGPLLLTAFGCRGFCVLGMHTRDL